MRKNIFSRKSVSGVVVMMVWFIILAIVTDDCAEPENIPHYVQTQTNVLS